MVSRNHNNRSEKQKGHVPNREADADPELASAGAQQPQLKRSQVARSGDR
jgi:hypothetical protein